VTPKPAEHYSYAVYAEPETAETFDARRFGGPIGELVAESQARVLLEFAGALRGASLLDVGTGTGRAALLFARAGAVVTGIDASERMLAVARQRASQAGADIRWAPGDAHELAFADASFDVVVSVRLLMHVPRWHACIGELCRVAKQRVIVDYPSAASVAAIEAAGRRLTHALGHRTEPYRVLGGAAVARAFAHHGFRITAVHRQFVLPIAFHKAVGSRRFTERVERQLERMGLLRLAGSPVTILAERCAH